MQTPLITLRKVSPLAVAVAAALSTASLAGLALATSAPATAETLSQPYAPTTPDFEQKVAFSGAFEIASARLVLERSQNQALKDFAERIVKDHNEANEELVVRTGVRSDTLPGATAVPGGFVSPEQAARYQNLKDSQGADFERTYLAQQVNAHTEAVTLFDNYAKYGDDWHMLKFAENTLPTLRGHLDHAQKLQGGLPAQAAPQPPANPAPSGQPGAPAQPR